MLTTEPFDLSTLRHPQARRSVANAVRTYATAKPAASEVSSILEQRISGASAGGDVQETGRVLSKFSSLWPPEHF